MITYWNTVECNHTVDNVIAQWYSLLMCNHYAIILTMWRLCYVWHSWTALLPFLRNRDPWWRRREKAESKIVDAVVENIISGRAKHPGRPEKFRGRNKMFPPNPPAPLQAEWSAYFPGAGSACLCSLEVCLPAPPFYKGFVIFPETSLEYLWFARYIPQIHF